jgi:5-dehydro-2-deoxygluconokinase
MAAARKFDFIALGRAAVDLYGEQIGGRLEDMTSFAKYLGGCPANISVGAARLGLKPAMLTRVGDEQMGRFVRETLAAEGVDVSHVRTDPTRLTALVILGIRGENSFPHIFYRDNVADMAVSPEDFDESFIASATSLLVTGTHFSTAAVDRASRTAMRHARAAGTRVVFDIDYRPVLWGLTNHGKGESRFIASDGVSAHLQGIAAECDLVVGTEDEFHIAGGSTDTFAALRRLRDISRAVFVMKRGPQGCVVFEDGIPNRIEDGAVHAGFPVEVFNVLGAGDGFMAGLLRGWLRGENWESACTYANACGALVVSRHGCAPAMPSARELDAFLARHGVQAKLHDDPVLAHLHRTTTGRRPWPEVHALAFDHRQQFEGLAARAKVPLPRITAFKRLIAEAVRKIAAETDAVGAIVDDQYGRDSLFDLGGIGLWLARPVERPGILPLEFQDGDDPGLTLRTWPAEHIVKCLIAYGADDPAPLRAAQEERLVRLQRACIATNHELLLELLPPQREGGRVGAPTDAIERLYAIGLKPDWWKLPPLKHPAEWRAVGTIIRANDPCCRGILVLGLDSGDEGLQESFVASASEPLVKGFAVGRFIFWAIAEEWFAGRLADTDAVSRLIDRYGRVCTLWHDARERQPSLTLARS